MRVSDVAEVSLDSENFSISARYNNKPAAALALRLATGANVLDTVEAVKDVLESQEPFLPPGLNIDFADSIMYQAKAAGRNLVMAAA